MATLRRPVRASRDQQRLCAARGEDPGAGSEGGQRHPLRPGAGARPAAPSWSARSCASTRPTPTCRTTSASTTASCGSSTTTTACSARAPRLDLVPRMPPELAYLPVAQTIWYLPTGLDPWNQLLGKMPGHYVRLYEIKFEGKPPLPEVHWPDQAAARHRGHVAGEAEHVAHARPARRGDQRLSRLPRPVGGGGGRSGPAHRAAGPARLRRPHRRAGPRVPQPLVHHRPQVLSRPGHRRARADGRLGERALGPLRGRAGHRGRPPLVLELRDGLPGRAERSRQSRPRAARQRRRIEPGGVAWPCRTRC